MGLRSIPLPRELVKVSGSEGFQVRGLSPDDIMRLFYRHRGQMSALFDQFAGSEAAAEGGASALGQILYQGAPQVVAEAILLAADVDPDADDFDAEIAHTRRFPAAVQLDALEKIGNLTFTSDMPLPKFLAVVLNALNGATAGTLAPPA